MGENFSEKSMAKKIKIGVRPSSQTRKTVKQITNANNYYKHFCLKYSEYPAQWA